MDSDPRLNEAMTNPHGYDRDEWSATYDMPHDLYPGAELSLTPLEVEIRDGLNSRYDALVKEYEDELLGDLSKPPKMTGILNTEGIQIVEDKQEPKPTLYCKCMNADCKNPHFADRISVDEEDVPDVKEDKSWPPNTMETK
jgi:hypothetical protein